MQASCILPRGLHLRAVSRGPRLAVENLGFRRDNTEQISFHLATSLSESACMQSRSVAMPIFTYVAVVSLGLIALLFILDVTLEKGAPPIVTSERQGLPQPWRPDPVEVLTAAPAPAPDMTSEAVLAAQPKVEAAPVAKSDAAPKKKHVTRRQPPDQYRQSYGWSRDPFGGFFGRF